MTRDEQISVSLVLVTADAAAQLVEVAQTKTVGAIDNNRVRVGNIEATLDDGRRKQHVGVAIYKPRHHLLQILGLHLTMADNDPRAWHEGAQFPGYRIDRRNAVVQEKDLAATVQFALDGVADDPLIILNDQGLDRKSVLGRCFDGAHVARASKCQVQRARNRRRTQRQHVHEFAQQLELFLLHYSEA